MHAHRLWFAALVAALTACRRAQPPPIAIEEYFARLDVAATAAVTCGTGIAPRYAHEVALKENLLDAAASLAKAKALIAAGIVRYDAAKAATCAESISLDASSCWGPEASSAIAQMLNDQLLLPALFSLQRPDSRDGLPDCGLIFTGTMPLGAQCYAQFDCATGYCDFRGPACPGTCRTFSGATADCNSDYCAPGLFCDGYKMHGDNPTCQAPGPVGTPCSAWECAAGLVCSYAGVCERRHSVGQPCRVTTECDDDGWCPQGVCVPRAGAGGPCTEYDSQGPSQQCRGNQVCIGYVSFTNTPGHCGPPQDVGGPCTLASKLAAPQGGHSTGCYEDLLCDATTLKCVVPPETGDPCSCDLSEPGNPCIEAYACDVDSAYCQDKVCQPLVADGAACTSFSQCHVGSCCGVVGSSRVCTSCYPAGVSCPRP